MQIEPGSSSKWTVAGKIRRAFCVLEPSSTISAATNRPATRALDLACCLTVCRAKAVIQVYVKNQSGLTFSFETNQET
jgi:hypothetical protein